MNPVWYDLSLQRFPPGMTARGYLSVIPICFIYSVFAATYFFIDRLLNHPAVGKRQLRIFRTDLAKHLATLPGREANVLLTNQTTLHGYIEKAEDDALLLRDLRRKPHRLNFADIEEIMLDRETAY